MIGRTISHYRILEKLGEGGMGVVYKAEDTKLGRTVALKFLPPRALATDTAKARFLQEARAAAALNHANVCTIYEVQEADGEAFIVMEYVDGPSLRERIADGPLSFRDAVETATGIARALEAAHGKGIVHRDIKPANILLTGDGQPKVLDFGLAKLADAADLTAPGSTVGTAAYMSPEQARGETVDGRSDLWAVGVVLYEMVTGKRPFTGDRVETVIRAILENVPLRASSARSDVPGGVERIIDRALEKNPSRRYGDAGEMVRDLEAAVAAAAAPTRGATDSRPSIAVLPFLDMSPEGDQEYFCEGIAEELLNALAGINCLRVAARTAAFQFRGKGHDVHEIGRKLHVDTILEGSVRKAGNRVRVTAQLINANDGYHLWSEKFDRDLDDVFAIQDEISLAIVERLKVKLLGDEGERLVKRHTESLEAHNLYLRGRYFWNKRHEAGLMKAIKCFEKAIEIDPDYAMAYSGIADAYICLRVYTAAPPADTLARAEEAARKALELDEDLAEAHTSMGNIRVELHWDWAGGEAHFKKAIALNPNYPTAHNWYANLLETLGRQEEALAEIDRAHELDPLSLVGLRNQAATYIVVGDYHHAEEVARRALEMDPEFTFVNSILAWVHWERGEHEEAIRLFETDRKRERSLTSLLDCWIGWVLTEMGRAEEAQALLDKLRSMRETENVPPVGFAGLCFALGHMDEGFGALEQAYEEHDSSLMHMRSESFRSTGAIDDPRFNAILRKMGLPEL